MSSLTTGDQLMLYDGMDGMFESISASFDIFGLRATQARKGRKDAGKLKLATGAQTFEQQRIIDREAREAKAMEGLRDKIITKTAEVERAAREAIMSMEKVRKLLVDPALAGDASMEDVDAQIADLEKGVVQIQTGTVIDTATFDTHALAVSYSDAQAALIAMNAVRNRAVAIRKGLIELIRMNGVEKLRAEEAARKDARQAKLDKMRAEAYAYNQRAEADQKAASAAMQSRTVVIRQIREVDEEIAEENRMIRVLRRQIVEFSR